MTFPTQKTYKQNLATIKLLNQLSQYNIEDLARQTAQIIFDEGLVTQDYQRASHLINILEFKPRLQKEILVFFKGKIPHNINFTGVSYKLSNRDESLINLPL
jgi:hypothetical protein